MDSFLWASVGAIFILILLSGFFSGSETAMTAASKPELMGQEKDGNKRAAMANALLNNKERLIGSLLLGNNLVNILASALATSVLMKLFGDAGVVYATLAMTFLVLIFAEVMPKTYALQHATPMAMAIAPIMKFLVFVFAPITKFIVGIAKLSLRLLGQDASSVSMGSSVEELRGVIEMHDGPEEETQERRAMLHSILDLEDVDVDEIMVHRQNVEMLDIDQPVSRIVEQVLESTYTRLPIWKDNPDNIIGVIHSKKLLRELKKLDNNVDALDIHKVASRSWFVPETTLLYDQLQAFRERHEHFAIVVDEYGSFMGVVTLEDILEEIVGDINDESDELVAGVRASINGSYLVDGTVTIRDLNRQFNWDLPDENYSTIAGLILHETKCIPDVGQAFAFFGCRFEIVRKNRNQMSLIRLYPPAKQDEKI